MPDAILRLLRPAHPPGLPGPRRRSVRQQDRDRLRDRAKDIIISGGENISTVEVEHALESRPAVREVAVVGVPDEKWGERPKAFVVLNPGADPGADGVTEAELIAHVRSHIARFKSSESIDFLATPLPRTGSGKVQKFDLREKEWADTSAGSRASDGPVNGAGQIARAARALREGLAKQRILWSPPAPPE